MFNICFIISIFHCCKICESVRFCLKMNFELIFSGTGFDQPHWQLARSPDYAASPARQCGGGCTRRGYGRGTRRSGCPSHSATGRPGLHGPELVKDGTGPSGIEFFSRLSLGLVWSGEMGRLGFGGEGERGFLKTVYWREAGMVAGVWWYGGVSWRMESLIWFCLMAQWMQSVILIMR